MKRVAFLVCVLCLSVPARSRSEATHRDFDDVPALPMQVASALNDRTIEQPFTSSRVFPGFAVLAYPYSTVGKLFFSTPEGERYCSGSVVASRLVLTAAHCVHSGGAGGTFTDFTFVPAARGGEAPLGSWNVTAVFVSEDWIATGRVPGPRDWALLETSDQGGMTISEVTGHLGVLAGHTKPNHVHVLGYPAAFDGGSELHQVTTASWTRGPEGTVVYGADMADGAGGGPWVQNFRPRSEGQPDGRRAASLHLRVVGLTSYRQSAPQGVGSSQLDESFERLFERACQHQEGNCRSEEPTP